ncbi:uncharacterized protein LOC129770869 isoform X2 [Toxorhynchites rutilus septentrionalis]|uniref:uncharacterized protein LOC129770869 isoform X2 n=1 Tax=Toxorhynchites rutilus septentrionalis TaxID=329112 RepID=UPI00247ADCC0|nr:uncharacterized protein LOC129770869 isoform X2 [Toxorhynchites rutilus septentrionalis]
MCKLASFAVIAAVFALLLGNIYCEADETASTQKDDDQHKLSDREHFVKAVHHIMRGAQLDMKHLQDEHPFFGPWKNIEHTHPTNDTGSRHRHQRLHSMRDLVPKLREAILQIIAIIDRAIEEQLLPRRMVMDLDTYIPDALLTLDQVEVAADYDERYSNSPSDEPSSDDAVGSEQAKTGMRKQEVKKT